MEHKGKVLTTEEVMKERSSKYEFIDFEEAAENYVTTSPDFEAEGFSEYQNGVFNGFITGAKFAQKELYTKEDMLEAFNTGNKRGHSGYPNTDNWTQPTFEDFLRKKKKKNERNT